MTQATLSAGQSGIGDERARNISAPAHSGALTPAKPGIQALIQDGVTAGFLPEHTLETRLAAVIQTATSTCLGALNKPLEVHKDPASQIRQSQPQLRLSRRRQ